MYKKLLAIPVTAVFLLLAACGANGPGGQAAGDPAAKPTRSIQYLGNTYKIPARTKQIAFVESRSSFEDALLTGIPPFAATVEKSGAFPQEYAAITQNTQKLPADIADHVGDLAALGPDTILTSDKTSGEKRSKLESAASVIPISSNGAHWEDNLRLLAEVRGKDANVDAIVSKVRTNTEKTRDKLAPLKDKIVLTAWFHEGAFLVYPKNERYNYLLYTDLGLATPSVVEQAKEPVPLSLAELAQADPDYLFVMVDKSSDPDAAKSFEQLKQQPEWSNLRVIQSGQVYENAVNPGLAGGTAYSNQSFLNALSARLLK
ncbi:ABC transporter substrate-binding protein [Brevibacillus agri]|uniref:ABC transporter substrate-binding protein n=1 Tax=Brevibacillus agri TaxID=51101 RepID=UPI002867F3C5|nr:ABC transporter substrate-binding protein [Brevibacillus agri]MED1822266.1 ABC transporter substrate-binding protein [Brevibacillus agri]